MTLLEERLVDAVERMSKDVNRMFVLMTGIGQDVKNISAYVYDLRCSMSHLVAKERKTSAVSLEHRDGNENLPNLTTLEEQENSAEYNHTLQRREGDGGSSSNVDEIRIDGSLHEDGASLRIAHRENSHVLSRDTADLNGETDVNEYQFPSQDVNDIPLARAAQEEMNIPVSESRESTSDFETSENECSHSALFSSLSMSSVFPFNEASDAPFIKEEEIEIEDVKPEIYTRKDWEHSSIRDTASFKTEGSTPEENVTFEEAGNISGTVPDVQVGLSSSYHAELLSSEQFERNFRRDFCQMSSAEEKRRENEQDRLEEKRKGQMDADGESEPNDQSHQTQTEDEPQSSSLQGHMRKRSAKRPYICVICKKKFSLKRNRKRHMLLHSGERPYSCSICQKSFTRNSHLQGHMRIHSRERLYRCQICQKTFTESTHLQVHKRMHSGVRPYTCSICHKSFARRPTLKKHMRGHTGEKPFHCVTCDKSFCTKENLLIHTRVHFAEKTYKCSVCGESFTTSCKLRIHAKVHSAAKLFKTAKLQEGIH